jgi:hypothetical protein
MPKNVSTAFYSFRYNILKISGLVLCFFVNYLL